MMPSTPAAKDSKCSRSREEDSAVSASTMRWRPCQAWFWMALMSAAKTALEMSGTMTPKVLLPVSPGTS